VRSDFLPCTPSCIRSGTQVHGATREVRSRRHNSNPRLVAALEKLRRFHAIVKMYGKYNLDFEQLLLGRDPDAVKVMLSSFWLGAISQVCISGAGRSLLHVDVTLLGSSCGAGLSVGIVCFKDMLLEPAVHWCFLLTIETLGRAVLPGKRCSSDGQHQGKPEGPNSCSTGGCVDRCCCAARICAFSRRLFARQVDCRLLGKQQSVGETTCIHLQRFRWPLLCGATAGSGTPRCTPAVEP
jgi:hypothetical protein